jgi:hypothetical protein
MMTRQSKIYNYNKEAFGWFLKVMTSEHATTPSTKGKQYLKELSIAIDKHYGKVGNLLKV